MADAIAQLSRRELLQPYYDNTVSLHGVQMTLTLQATPLLGDLERWLHATLATAFAQI